LLKSINDHLKDIGGRQLPESILQQSFDTYWPKLKEKIEEVMATDPTPVAKVGRGDREVLDEILELVRNQAKQISTLASLREPVNEVEAIFNELQRRNRPLVLAALEDAQQLEYRNGVLIATFDGESILMRRISDSATLFHEIGEKLFGQPLRIEVRNSRQVEEETDITETQLHGSDEANWE